MHKVPIVPPKHGLNDGFAYSEQPEMTTAISKNMRTMEASSGRLRVGQRAGYTKYNPFPLLKNFIAYSENISRNGDSNVSPTEGWGVNFPGSVSIEHDGQLGPDGAAKAWFAKQANGGNSNFFFQYFDYRATNANPNEISHPGADLFLSPDGGAGQSLVFTIFLKHIEEGAATRQSRIILRQSNDLNGADGEDITSVVIDWTTAGVASINGSSIGTYGFSEEPNGWYRFFAKIDWNASAEGTNPILRCEVIPHNASGNSQPFGVYAWGAQLEAGVSLPTAYHSVVGRNDLEAKRKTASLVALNHSQKWLDHQEIAELEPERTTAKTPKKRDAKRIETDEYGNYYVIDGLSSVVKFNSEWEEVFQIDVPVPDAAHVCEALHVDRLGCIYVAVSKGGEQATARLWKYRQGPAVGADGEVQLESYHELWEVTLGAYCVDLATNEAELYAALNHPDLGYSEVVVYSGIDTTAPQVDRRVTTSYPTHGMAVKADGSFVVTAPPESPRGIVPGDVLLRGTAVGWQPTDYTQYMDTVHVWLDSRRINGAGTDTLEDFEHGDQVTQWFDVTGKNRSLSVATDKTAPTVNTRGIGRFPTVSFDGLTTGLQSGVNPSESTASESEQRSLFPGISDEWTAFVIFRPAYKATQGAVLGQANTDDTSPDTDAYRVLCSNRTASNTVSSASDGYISFFDHADGTSNPASGTDSHPGDYRLNFGGLNRLNCAVATMRVSNTGNVGTFRVNGNTGEADYDSKATAGTKATQVGYFTDTSGDFGHYEGEICEILVYNAALSDDDVELHEGYFANKWGFQRRLNSAHTYYADPAAQQPSAAPILPEKPDPNKLNNASTVLAKFSKSGDLVWALTDYYGVGFDVVEDPDGNLFTIGETQGVSASLGVLTGMTWTESTKTLSKAASSYFGAWTHAEGATIKIVSGTGAIPGIYRIASKTSGDAVVLEESIGIAADGQTDIEVSQTYDPRTPGTKGGSGYLRKIIDNGDSANAETGPVEHSEHNLIPAYAARGFNETGFWTHNNVTVTANSTTGPDGTTTADTVDDSSAGAFGNVLHDFAEDELVAGEPYTFSVYVKENDSTEVYIRLDLRNASPSVETNMSFTFATESVDLDGSTGSGLHYGGLEQIDDEWYRLWVTMTYDPEQPGAGGAMRVELQPDRSGTSGQASAYFWGAQLERGIGPPTEYTEGPVPVFTDKFPRLKTDTFGNLFVSGVQRDQAPATLASSTSDWIDPSHSARIFDPELRLKRTLRFGKREDGSLRMAFDSAPNLFPPDYIEQNPGETYNLLIFTESFAQSGGYWSNSGSLSVTANQGPGPDGTITADLLTPASTLSSVTKALSTSDIADLQKYTFSIYLKAITATESAVALSQLTGNASTRVDIDWSTTPPTATRTDTGTGTTHNNFLEEASNGFWRFGVTLDFDSSRANNLTIQVFADDDAGTGTVQAWGAQLEEGNPSILRKYQAIRGSTPYSPTGTNLNELEVTDKVAFAAQSRPNRTEDFGDSNVWATSSASVTVNEATDPFEDTMTGDLLTASGAGGTVTRSVAKGTLVDDEPFLMHKKVYRFRCYIGDAGGTSASIELAASDASVLTRATLTFSDGTIATATAGNGNHEAMVTKIAQTAGLTGATQWYLVEVGMTYDLNAGDGTMACIIKPGATGTGNCYAWGAQVFPDGGFDSIQAQPLVQETPNGLEPRSTKLIAVSLGCVLNVNQVSRAEIIRGGSSALDQKARYISATTLFQKYFATDGASAIVYDPVKTGVVEPFKATTAGEVPKRAQLVSNYRGRLVMARTPEDPHAWYASAIEDPFDWDYFTPPLIATQAVFFGTSRAGRAPDIINSICPYDDQRMILGCDHALWYLQGDPLAGGTWQLLSDITGMHYGNRAWCKDPKGVLYFFGSRGGFYAMAPGGRPERLTENTIERRLSDINLDEYYVECLWNYRAEGIHIFVIPFGGGGTIVQHYFWGRRTNEWREDEFSVADVQPTAAAVIDGDRSDDRRLLIATEDLQILKWDEATKNDDGNAISAREVFGPLRPPFDTEARWGAFEAVLSSGSDGATFNLYASETPEALGSVRATGSLVGGRNPRKVARVKGANIWLEMTNDTAGESFSFEHGTLFVSEAGRTRDR